MTKASTNGSHGAAAKAEPSDPHARDVLAPLTRATQSRGPATLAERLTEIRAWLADDLGQMEKAFRDPTHAKADGNLAERAGAWLVARPGKRIRPLCAMLAARVGGRSFDAEVRNLAVACELVHTATLLHDDVIDEGSERRGADASRVVYGNAASVLAGDHLLVKALVLVQRTGQAGLLASLLDTIQGMVASEAVQLEQRGRFEPHRETYLDIVNGKTAALFRWALVAGGTAGGLEEEALAGLARCGDALGLAFQLMDDVLDLTADPDVLGKGLLVDLREGKLTWPFIVAAERDQATLDRVADFTAGGTTSAAEIVASLHELGGVEETRRFAREQAENAASALVSVPSGRAREAIEVVIETAVARSL